MSEATDHKEGVSKLPQNVSSTQMSEYSQFLVTLADANMSSVSVTAGVHHDIQVDFGECQKWSRRIDSVKCRSHVKV